MRLRTLPYLPFRDFVAALDAIAPDPPAHIDPSCWSRFPSLNKNGRVLCDIFRYLGLVSADGAILSALSAMLDPNTRTQTLGNVLREAYPFVNPKDLRGATIGRLKELFRQKATGSSMSRKALSFYLKAATAARLELHPSLMPRERQRSRKAAPDSSYVPEAPASEPLVLEERLLGAGGSLTLRLEGQPFNRLTGTELELATALALLFKRGEKPADGVAVIPRRLPVSAKQHHVRERARRS